MNLTISGHHLEVTPALREYVLTKLDRVTRHFDQVVDINVLLTVEKQKEKDRRQRAEVTLHVKGRDIFVEQSHEDLYAAIDQLMDKEWPEDQRAAFLDVAARQPGLKGIHDFRTRRSGSHDFAQFHMEVDRNLTVGAAHDIVEGVERNLRQMFPKVEVLIHLDPEGHVDTDNPLVEADVTPHWFGKRVGY